MRNIIHDHEDSDAQKILHNTISAFDKDSLLLIDDMVLPDTGIIPWRAALYDLTMMSALAAKERTETEWYALLESAGLKVIKIWKYAVESGDSIIVAKPAQFL
jgi:demethylsterigmatocystin 6-O-methyltransferase